MQQVLALLRPFGVDLFCTGKKFLVFNMVSRNLKIKYRRSVLGIAWTLVSPLAQAAVFYFVFKVIMNIQIPHYLAFILSGMLPWSFFSQSLIEGMDSIVGGGGLITKVPVPIQSFPYVVSLTNLITLVLAIPILIGASAVSDVRLGASLAMLPVFFACLFLMAYSISLISAIFYVYFRDLKHLMTIILQIWFYGTPVIYAAEMIPAKYQWILYANPVGAVFVGLHRIMGEGAWPHRAQVLITAGWTAFFVAAAALLYQSLHRDIAENL